MKNLDKKKEVVAKRMKKSKEIDVTDWFMKKASKDYNPFKLITHVSGKPINDK